MELEMRDVLSSLSDSVQRLSAAAGALEMTASKLEQREAAISGEVQKITAAVETGGDFTRRELELERKLAMAEQEIATLHAQVSAHASAPASFTSVRKTLPAATVQLLAKQGLDSFETMSTATLDAALSGLSIEQRLAVKSQLLRTGALIS
jgi:hypothetical protein